MKHGEVVMKNNQLEIQCAKSTTLRKNNSSHHLLYILGIVLSLLHGLNHLMPQSNSTGLVLYPYSIGEGTEETHKELFLTSTLCFNRYVK